MRKLMSLLTLGFAVACGNADSTAIREPPLGASGFVSYPAGSGGFVSSTGGASTVAPMAHCANERETPGTFLNNQLGEKVSDEC